jgi:hypothetical protein
VRICFLGYWKEQLASQRRRQQDGIGGSVYSRKSAIFSNPEDEGAELSAEVRHIAPNFGTPSRWTQASLARRRSVNYRREETHQYIRDFDRIAETA